MSLIDIIKDYIGGPKLAFKKLLTPWFLNDHQARLSTEEYAKWLSKQYTYYLSMAYSRKHTGLSIPEQWVEGLRIIEDEIEKVKKNQGVSDFFMSGEKRASEEFQTS